MQDQRKKFQKWVDKIKMQVYNAGRKGKASFVLQDLLLP